MFVSVIFHYVVKASSKVILKIGIQTYFMKQCIDVLHVFPFFLFPESGWIFTLLIK